MVKSTFLNDLQTADSEKLVESAYHAELKRIIGKLGGLIVNISTSVKTDGVIEAEFKGTPYILKLIIENKFNETFSLALTRSRALAQVVYYLRKIEDLGNDLPNIVLIGDRDECFVIHSSYLDDYLSKSYDWTLAPSEAGIKNTALVDALKNNNMLQAQCFVFLINKDFDMTEVMEKALQLLKDKKIQLRITEKRISKVFDYFSMKILMKNENGTSKYKARDQVELFMLLILHPEECYIHPNKKNTAVFNSIPVMVNTDLFEPFINFYNFNYNALEKKDFTAICDRLIEDSERRMKGGFYTPSVWVDEAHKLLGENLAPDWKDTFIVWDPAWGTGNLTRDYHFCELYCSTLHENDLKIGEKYNQRAVKFQYDFLNDDVKIFNQLWLMVKMGYKLSKKDFAGTKLLAQAPNLIDSLLNRKKLLFFINPPYGTSKSGGAVTGNSKVGISETEISSFMTQEGLGYATRQIYLQFIYTCSRYKELFDVGVLIGVFCPSAFYTYTEYSNCRQYILNSCKYVDSILLQASNFADVANNWCIAFSFLDSSAIPLTNTISTVKELDKCGIVGSNKKVLYALENENKASNWCRRKLSGSKTKATIYLKTPLNVGDTIRENSIFTNGFIGGFWCNSNIVEKNAQFVSLWSAMCGYPACFSVSKDSLFDVVSYFTARRLIVGQYATWVNGKDEYMIPDDNHPNYQQWVNDCLVYALFNTSSNQSSLRNIPYNDELRDVYNEFFFMSRDDMRKLALGEHSNDDVYYDLQIHAQDERYLYTLLQQATLSADALAVLVKASELVVESFKFRKQFNLESPGYQINTWDAGWYQIKGLLNAYMRNELRDFFLLYRNFEDRMRPLVYELGFLYE